MTTPPDKQTDNQPALQPPEPCPWCGAVADDKDKWGYLITHKPTCYWLNIHGDPIGRVRVNFSEVRQWNTRARVDGGVATVDDEQPAYDGSMTSEQLERAVLVAESREIDLETAQELVYLHDRVALPEGVYVDYERDSVTGEVFTVAKGHMTEGELK